jgi:hypothetical protein
MRNMRWVLVLAAIFGLSAATPQQDPWYAQVQALLAADADEMASYDLMLSHEVMYGSLNDDGRTSFTARLNAGTTYYILGECDEDCYDLDLKLYRYDWTLVVQDIGIDRYAVIRVTPNQTRTYRIQPVMASCDSNPCRWGIGIFSGD